MKKVLFLLSVFLAVPFLGVSADAEKTASTRKVLIPKIGKTAHFIHRDAMRSHISRKRAHLPGKAMTVPVTTLPVDCTNNRAVSCPMYLNDSLGDCGEAMAAHTIGILSYAQGKRPEILFTDAAIRTQYLAESGGDNGMDEDMEVGPTGVFTVGVCGNPKAVAVSSMDVDPNNVPLVQYLIDQFYTLQLAWSVPDDFVQNFTSGSSWLNADTPDPANGHYTTISDITKEGYYTLWTWGGYATVSQSFVASVQPSYFVVFSPLQFDPATGYDSHGRHITSQAAAWQACGGPPIPQAVIAAFPPVGGPTPEPPPAPIPTPVPPSPTPTPTPPPNPPQQTFSVVIPASTVSMRGPLGKTYTGTVPSQTVTGTITAPQK